MKMKIKKFYEARLYIGCYDNKNGRFSEDDLTTFIKTCKTPNTVITTNVPVSETTCNIAKIISYKPANCIAVTRNRRPQIKTRYNILRIIIP